jgi:hypothetical protein
MAKRGAQCRDFCLQMGVSTPPRISAASPPKLDASHDPGHGVPATLTPAQVAAATRALIASGASQEAVSEALAKDGLVGPEAEQRTPKQVAHDAEFGAGPFTADMYRQIDWRELPKDLQGRSIEERAEIDRDFRQYAADLRLPPALGSSLIEHALRVAGELRSLSPAEREAWKQAGANQIAATYPTQEAFDAAAGSIQTLLDFAGKEHPITTVLKSGHLCSPWLWATIANHAEHMSGWLAVRPEGKRK